MPPSPIVKVSLNEPEYARLIAELGITAPPRVIVIDAAGPKQRIHGTYRFGTNTTTIYTGLLSHERERLTFVSRELSEVVLHETRHAWQYQAWGVEAMDEDEKLPYWHQRAEIDAREFQARRCADYRRLVNVARKFPSSPLSRLAAVERAATRRVA